MPKVFLHRLTAKHAVQLDKPGRHGDGGGLYLCIGSRRGNKRAWSFLYRSRATGKLTEIGLGPAAGPKKAGMALSAARQKAAAMRDLLYAGIDPLAHKRSHKPSQDFGTFADALLKDIGASFRNPKHYAQWETTLETQCAPLRPLPLDSIDTEAVLKVIKPLWETTPETANRARGRIEKVLDAAAAKGLRRGENPARWRGHLDHLLPRRSKLSRGHHAALPYAELPDFMRDLRTRNSISARALELTILSATRTAETIGARCSEFDLGARTWTIPAARMKAGVEHVIPLSDRAVAVLKSIRLDGVKPRDYVFPGLKPEAPLSNMAMLELLRGMRGKGVTVHGFRSAFRDWAGDQTAFPRELIEEALAHVIQNKAEAAYRRGTALEKRRKLMAAWDRYLTGDVGKVVRLRRTGR